MSNKIHSEDPASYGPAKQDNEHDPIQKFIDKGPDALSNAEIISIFLRDDHTSPDDAVKHARNLLEEWKGVGGLLRVDRDKLAENGTISVYWVRLQAALELSNRYLETDLMARPVMDQHEDVKKYMRTWLSRYEYEVFACMFLDNRLRLISAEILSTGTIDGASVYPREVVKRALKVNAAAVIFGHNHPSGIAEPSQADRQITLKLVQSLQLLDIRSLDHIVVGDNSVTSMSERGLM